MALSHASIPVGIVVRRSPGVTRWSKHAWKVVAVLPGAPDAQWKELRREGEVVEFHAATLPLELWSTDTEAYLTGLSAKVPSVTVVLREDISPDAVIPWKAFQVTASPHEAQDHADSGEGLIEQVPMPAGLIAWVQQFCDAHHVHEPFIKRKRDRQRVDLVEDGIGDPRIRQTADVYRAPKSRSGGVH